MSSTPRPIDGLDPVNLTSNVGANPQTVFSAALGAGAIVDNRLRIDFSNPYTFAGTSGNLLLQIGRTNAGPTLQAGFLVHAPGDGFPEAAGLASRAHDFNNTPTTGNAAIYLVTRFHQQRCQCPTEAPCTC